MSEMELLPCPFCGLSYFKTVGFTGAYVRCGNCGVRAAKSIWNHRTVPPEVGKLIEAARVAFRSGVSIDEIRHALAPHLKFPSQGEKNKGGA